MICSNCGSPNPADGRFCNQCGMPLGGCPTCGAINPAGARFCGTCGTRLVPATPQDEGRAPARSTAPEPAPPGADVPEAGGAAVGATERRVVSVLFADLVGFTLLSATRDPEAMRELQARYFERTREIVARYGGVVEKFIGDAVMALWGAPTAHEDDAERCVRAALDLVDAVEALGREVELPLQLRAGALTGEAAVVIGAQGQGMVTGDMVNTAARLQSVAPPGGVLVGEATRLAAAGAIAFEPAGEQILKGKPAPVPAWQALRVVAERGGARRTDALEPPFVGRADELRFLKEQFHATGREGRARLVSLVGQAGIGKSRLAWELEKYLDGVVERVWWHRGRSPSYGEGVTFWALGEMIRRRAGLAEGDDEQRTRRAVAVMLEQHVPDPSERAWIEPRILVLLGIGEVGSGGQPELFAAWRTFFERLAQTGTVALVVEDLQWSDDGLLDFLEHLLDWARSSPIFVLTLSRPELLERRPGWGSDRRGAISVRLEPLGEPAMRELLAGIAPGLPATIVERILERADGIPLYAVETLRMLVAKGQLVSEGGRLQPRGDLGGGQLDELDTPPTLHALVAARLDALPPADRALLQDAAVLGQSFAIEALAAMTGETPAALSARLGSLVRRELLAVETDPRAPTRGQHAFVQALLREVAYSTLSKRERRSRHLAAARHFETLAEDELAGVVASHFIAAYRAAPEGPEGEAVATQARISLLATADRAAALGALGQASDALTSALEVTRAPQDRARLLERLGVVQSLNAKVDESQANLLRATEAFEALGDRAGVIGAVANRVLGLLAASRITRAEEIATPFLAEAETLADALERNDPALPPAAGEVIARFSEAIGRLGFRSQDTRTAIRWSDRALALAERLRLDEIFAMALITKASAMTFFGHRREGLALLHGGVQDAQAHGQHFAALRGGVNLSSVTSETDPRASLDRTREGMALARRLGLRGFDGYHAGNGAGSAELLGEWAWISPAIGELLDADPDRVEAEWLASCRDAVTAWTGNPDVVRGERLMATAVSEGDSQTELNIALWLGRCAFAAGRPDDAIAYSAPFFRHGDEGKYFQDAGMVGRFALHAGRLDLAERVLTIVGSGPGDLVDHDIEAVRAGIAALQGRTGDAVALYRAALAAYRDYGARFVYALTILDMATFVGPEEAAVRALLPEAREILAELGAATLLARLDALDAGVVSTRSTGGEPRRNEGQARRPIADVDAGAASS